MEYVELYLAFHNKANAQYKFGLFKEAIDLFESSLKIAEDLGDKDVEGATYSNLGSCYFSMKDYNKAIEYYKLCLNCMTEEDNMDLKVHVYSCLGDAYFNLNNFKRAIDNYHVCLQVLEEVGDVGRRGISDSIYRILSEIYSKTGEYKNAIHFQELRLKASIERGDLASERSAYYQLATAYYNSKEYEKAVELFELYLAVLRSAEGSEEGVVCSILGKACHKMFDFERALIYQQRCLKIMTQLGDKTRLGNTYSDIGDVYFDRGDTTESAKCYEQHLKVAKENEDRLGEGRASKNMGFVQLRRGNFKAAIKDFELCLEIAKEIGDKSHEASALGGLGVAHDNLGHFKKAMEFFQLQLQIAKELPDKKVEESSYCNLGNTCLHLGNFKQALVYHTQLLNSVKESGDRKGEEVAYGSIGTDNYKLGFLKEAIENHERQLEIVKELGDKDEEARVCGNLGNDYRSLGNLKKAKYYYELSLKAAKKTKAKAVEGGAYANLGIVYRLMEKFEKAEENHNRHLKKCIELGDRPGEGQAYGNLGLVYADLGDLAKALEYHKLCLEVAKEVKDKALEGHAYGNIGNTYKQRNVIDKALEYHKLQRKISIEVDDKIGQAKANYSLGVDFGSKGSLCEALHCYESSLSIFNDLRKSLQSNDVWKIDLQDVYKYVYANLWRVLIAQDKIGDGLIAAEQGRAQALTDLLKSRYGFEVADHGRPPQKISIDDTLSCILSNIVFTAVHMNLICHWVLQKENVCPRKLSIKHDVHLMLAATCEKIRDMVKVEDSKRCEDRSLDRLRNNEEESEGCVQRRPAALPNQDNPFRTLYDLTISPIIDLIHGDELIVVPEGPLWLAPYAAFMDPNSRYLSESFRIRFIPSLLSLKLILDCPTDYHSKSGALLVGDPWIEEVKPGQQLVYAKKEVDLIAKILHTTPLTGKEATKDEVLKQLSNVALVHIAAHGRMETGEIALSPNPSRESKIPKDEDYLLRMKDVLDAKLQAKLVVLSCCHSGRGEIKAEGVVGIARAFIGAGARSVLVTLWAIDDEATLEFMKHFYQHLVKGKSASESLNRAMRCMRESEDFSEIKYWAPFVLIGDDVTLQFCGSS